MDLPVLGCKMADVTSENEINFTLSEIPFKGHSND
jgi:hypothetical protein